ncbi:CSN8/PSD8/EIF3K family protein [Gelidibacter sp. F2691]|nr:CSN8/PSD8/EIF3K family protein [Gelidibacter sp. F2691]
MKQVKWEDDVKDALEKRVIKPSETSWSTLSERLDASEKQQAKPMYWWIGIAASVTAVLFITTMFFSGNTPEIQNPILVDTEEQHDEQTFKLDQLQQEQQVVEQKDVLDSDDPIEGKQEPKRPMTSKTTRIVKSSQIAQESPIGSENVLETLEHQKVTEIVAHIEDLKRKGEVVTDVEIEALLTKAQRDLNYQSALQETNSTVDANALLQDVEADLQESFRNKIFEALKNSYETIKTAVAERQN